MARDRMASLVAAAVVACGGAALATGAPGQRAAALATGAPDQRVAAMPTLAATPVDLGTLGGEESRASAIDGDIVVGSAQTPSGAWHAFVVDMGATTPQMRDLGTLGGRHSSASDIDGSLVVGTSKTSGGGFRVFVHDLADPASGLVDLGIRSSATYTDGPTVGDGVVAGETWTGRRTAAFSYDTRSSDPQLVTYGAFGGRNSSAFATDDGVVVGFGMNRSDERQAFAVDTRAADPRMIALDPDSQFSGANDVDNGLVVGSSTGLGAFAYDLRAADPGPTSLGHLGGGSSGAVAVDGRIVAGSSSVASGKIYGATFDLRAGTPDLTTLGSLGGWGRSVEVHGTRVVGYSLTPAHHLHGFVYDLADSPAIADLGVLPGYTWAVPTDVDADLVVGRVDAPRSRAVAWRLVTSDEPQLRFGRLRHHVEEGAGHAVVAVRRLGDSTGSATVDVVPAPAGRFRARPGLDFGPMEPVTFAPGQTRATLSIPILQDDASEAEEILGLQLAEPEGAVLGTPQAAAVRIATSDLRPDLLIYRRSDAGVLGDDVFNSTGVAQTRRAVSPPGGTRELVVKVCNDLVTPVRDTVWGGTFSLTASPAAPGSRIRYSLPRQGGITAAMRAPGGFDIGVRAQDCRRVKIEIRVPADAEAGSVHRAVVTALWRGDGVPRVDAVRAVVRVVD